jgi:hypothetical protein
MNLTTILILATLVVGGLASRIATFSSRPMPGSEEGTGSRSWLAATNAQVDRQVIPGNQAPPIRDRSAFGANESVVRSDDQHFDGPDVADGESPHSPLLDSAPGDRTHRRSTQTVLNTSVQSSELADQELALQQACRRYDQDAIKTAFGADAEQATNVTTLTARTPVKVESDSIIHDRIWNTLLYHSPATSRLNDITIVVLNGRVILKGMVDSEQRSRLVQDAAEDAGARQVHNQLIVRGTKK